MAVMAVVRDEQLNFIRARTNLLFRVRIACNSAHTLISKPPRSCQSTVVFVLLTSNCPSFYFYLCFHSLKMCSPVSYLVHLRSAQYLLSGFLLHLSSDLSFQ